MLEKLINAVGTVFVVLISLALIVIVLGFIFGVIVLGIKVSIFLLLFGVCCSIARKIIDWFRYR